MLDLEPERLRVVVVVAVVEVEEDDAAGVGVDKVVAGVVVVVVVVAADVPMLAVTEMPAATMALMAAEADPSRDALRFRGRPRSMMLPDSDCPRRWPRMDAADGMDASLRMADAAALAAEAVADCGGALRGSAVSTGAGVTFPPLAAAAVLVLSVLLSLGVDTV